VRGDHKLPAHKNEYKKLKTKNELKVVLKSVEGISEEEIQRRWGMQFLIFYSKEVVKTDKNALKR